jgi:hypothetical protein
MIQAQDRGTIPQETSSHRQAAGIFPQQEEDSLLPSVSVSLRPGTLGGSFTRANGALHRLSNEKRDTVHRGETNAWPEKSLKYSSRHS